MNEQFVYLKLVTGEQLMAYKESEDATTITIKFPMLIKSHMIKMDDERISEQATAGPYSLFAATPVVHLNKNHIVMDAQLSERAIPHYVHLVKDHEGVSLEYQAKQLLWEDEERETLESFPEALKALEQLRALAEEIEEESNEGNKTFVEGNETLH